MLLHQQPSRIFSIRDCTDRHSASEVAGELVARKFPRLGAIVATARSPLACIADANSGASAQAHQIHSDLSPAATEPISSRRSRCFGGSLCPRLVAFCRSATAARKCLRRRRLDSLRSREHLLVRAPGINGASASAPRASCGHHFHRAAAMNLFASAWSSLPMKRAAFRRKSGTVRAAAPAAPALV